MGYTCRYTLLNSAHYGVPPMRERMFLIALASELGQAVTVPAPTSTLFRPVTRVRALLR